jgi:hypothetical protein
MRKNANDYYTWQAYVTLMLWQQSILLHVFEADFHERNYAVRSRNTSVSLHRTPHRFYAAQNVKCVCVCVCVRARARAMDIWDETQCQAWTACWNNSYCGEIEEKAHKLMRENTKWWYKGMYTKKFG